MELNDILSTVIAVCCVLLTSVLVFLYLSKGRKSKHDLRTVLLFMDAPDPDNPACALAIWSRLLQGSSSPQLYIVLTGRPVDLKTRKHFRDDTPIQDQITRQSWEESVPSHSQRLLVDSAARISNFLVSCGIDSDSFTICDGGIAPCAPISDVAHDWDFIFDRKDLFTNNSRDEGRIVTGAEYSNIVNKFNLLDETERENALLDILRPYELTLLSELRTDLCQCEQITVILGGPVTAVVELFKGDQNALIRDKVTEFYGMFGALRPDKSTLLGNQFNAACDIDSASELFVEKLFPNVPMYLIPTETAKQPALIVSANELETRGAHPYVISLMRLWESTHNDRPQPLFDVLPVMASLPQFKNVFNWKRKKVVIQDWHKQKALKQRFLFMDTDNGSLFVSDGQYNSDRETYLNFLDTAFKHA